ncbi:MAG: hypothetical protein L6Q33_02055 [Bacteriovoracaceae bacterium]|nr:hypothetical protein [Bacteriovoracaceae bacterium]
MKSIIFMTLALLSSQALSKSYEITVFDYDSGKVETFIPTNLEHFPFPTTEIKELSCSFSEAVDTTITGSDEDKKRGEINCLFKSSISFGVRVFNSFPEKSFVVNKINKHKNREIVTSTKYQISLRMKI